MRLSEKVFKGVAWNFLGIIVVNIIGVLYTIASARIMGKELYGIFSLVLSVLTTVSILTSLGCEYAINKFIPQYRTEKKYGKIKTLMSKVTWMRVTALLFASITIFISSEYLARNIFGIPDLQIYLDIVCILMFPFALQNNFRAFLTTFYHQRFINIVDISLKTMNFILTLYLLLIGYRIIALLLVNLLTESTVLLLFLKKYLSEVKTYRRAPVKFPRMFKYSLILFIYTVLHYVLGPQLDIIMLGIFKRPHYELGFYSIGYNFPYFSLSILTFGITAGGFSIAFFSELYSRKDMRGLKKAYSLFFEYIYMTMIPVCIGGILLRNELINLLYGKEYTGSATIMLIMFMTLLLLKGTMITFTCLSSMDMEKKLLYSRGIFGLSNFIMNLILIPRFGAVGAAIGTGLAGVFIFLYESYIVHNLIHPSYPVAFTVKVLAASLIMGIFVFVLNLMGVHVVIVVAIGSVIYLLLLPLLRPLSPEIPGMISAMDLPLKKTIVRLLEKSSHK